MLTPAQTNVLETLTCDLEYNSDSNELTEVVANWSEFQSRLLKTITSIRDSLKENEDSEEESEEDDTM